MSKEGKHVLNDKNIHRVFIRDEITQFKDRLRQAMGGESGNSFAKRCGISEAALRTYLSGKTYPALDKLAVLAEKCEVSIEWLAIGKNSKDDDTQDTVYKDTPKHVTEEQEKAWLAFLYRMTAEEREAVIDRVFRQGINVLLTPPQMDIQQESQFPWPEDLPAKLGVSNNSLAFAQLYASLTDEQRQRFLESINDKEHVPANHNKMSSKAG
ncbi:helix-turn-helix domain-containing protein [Photorhabdus hainanensis]|uniref:helix-turn-helix domain-containing protein n=1 Tax=Photorhabdus hainanensis TaxID=1004166 RepID=UPI001BD275B0|nr:helix-turn-helix transcriptional regulator [Photorhabdus hainanensis]MBS9432716.1 XRE family transcriptional regulator [Photorhabdus hainanensis]